jgi:hypothetical protein
MFAGGRAVVGVERYARRVVASYSVTEHSQIGAKTDALSSEYYTG